MPQFCRRLRHILGRVPTSLASAPLVANSQRELGQLSVGRKLPTLARADEVIE